MADVELLPCPFCGSGKTEIRENGRPWLGMRYGDPSSVSVRHWCEPIDGQPSRMIERVGRDRAAAIAAWNTRATDANLAPLQAEIERLRAERDSLARENEAMKRCATKYLEWLGVTHMPLDQALRDDMLNPRMCGDAALAQQHGGSTDG